MKKLLVALGLVLSACSAAGAYTFDQAVIEYWAGTGGNRAVTVVDFGSASYAFGYRWDGQASGWDMLQAITAAGSLGMEYTMWNFGTPENPVLVPAVDELTYGGNVATSDWVNTFLGYWGSADGEAWITHDVGVAGRPLADGDWDGWSLESVSAGWWPISPPQTPVPGPGAIVLLLAGVGLLRPRGRRATGGPRFVAAESGLPRPRG